MRDPLEITEEMLDSERHQYFAEPTMEEYRNACFGIGPLDVCVTSITADAIKVDIKLAGVRIARGTVSTKDPQLCVSANVGLAKVSLCVEADFTKTELWVRGKVCVAKFPKGWSCRKFSTKLLDW